MDGRARVDPAGVVGWGLPIFYAWIPLVAGPSLLSACRCPSSSTSLVLGPLALISCGLSPTASTGGCYAWAAAPFWVAGPVLAICGVLARGTARASSSTSSHLTGPASRTWRTSRRSSPCLRPPGLRSAPSGTAASDSALGAGVLGGVLIGLKPANGFFCRRSSSSSSPGAARVALGWAAGSRAGAPDARDLEATRPRDAALFSSRSRGTRQRRAARCSRQPLRPARLAPPVRGMERARSTCSGIFGFWSSSLVAGALGALRRNVRYGPLPDRLVRIVLHREGDVDPGRHVDDELLQAHPPGLCRLRAAGPCDRVPLAGHAAAADARLRAESWTLMPRSPLALCSPSWRGALPAVSS